MAFKMAYDKDKMSGIKPVTPGLYEVAFVKFKPKLSAKKEGKAQSINLNAEVTIVNHAEFTGQKVFATLNEGIPGFIQDFVHSFGVEMENQLSDSPGIPGIFDANPGIFKADDPTTWVYAGPLVGKHAKWELGVKMFQGREQQEIRTFICAIPDCASKFPEVRHATDMARKGE